jgi:hypothetical protein
MPREGDGDRAALGPPSTAPSITDTLEEDKDS